jgi:hypothetical protein
MRMRLYTVCLSAVLLFATTCASETPDGAPTTEPQVSSTDPVSATWTGDWGPSAQDRNPVTLELRWDSTNLTGTINPGEKAVQLSTGSFDPATGAIRMEADTQSFDGPVHYVIEGKVEGSTMTGTWRHERRQGDFRVTRQ